MNRRHLIQLSILAALGTTGQVNAARKSDLAAGSPKKGLGLGPKKPHWKDLLEELRCKWTYSWMPNLPEEKLKNITFVPMVPKIAGIDQALVNAVAAAKKEKSGTILCFNEPDQKSQGDTTVEQALGAWPDLQKTSLRLGSPACVHPDNEWMKSFMEGVRKRDLKVDFVCVHSYGKPDSNAFIKRLQAIHDLYRKPIWITEFAIGDWTAKSTEANQYKPDVVLKFMEEVLPQLDKLDFIERYAWFPAGLDNKALCTSALFDSAGKLTRLGECYRDM